MKKLLTRKVLKVVPVWLMLLLLVGTTLAAVNWISNRQYMNTTVSVAPITLSGMPTTETAYVGIEKNYTIDYTVNSGTPTGYLILTFSPLASKGDVVAYASILPNGALSRSFLSSPEATYAQGIVQFVFSNSSQPIAFGSTQGDIFLEIMYTVTATVECSLQVSSSL